MRNSFFLTTSILVLFLSLFIFTLNNNKEAILKEDNLIESGNETLSNNYLNNNEAMTIYDIASFLINKKEHYPISDEFTEKYQQSGGGYISYAKQLGLIVDKQQHEPNQKWHFFDSWLIRSIEDGTLSWDSDARSRVYIGLKNPELLLWIYEATGVSPEKVKEAMEVAVKGKVTNEHVSTTAKKMRDCVPWEDIKINYDIKMATDVTFLSDEVELASGEELTITANVEPIETTDIPSFSILEGNDSINIRTTGNELTIQGIKPGKAIVKVTYNKYVEAELSIIVKEPVALKIIGLSDLIDFDIGDTLALNPMLNKEESTFSYESSNNQVVTVSNEGVITAIDNGSAVITVSSDKYPELTKIVNIEVFNHGSEENPLSVEEVINLEGKLLKKDESYTSKMIYVKGKAKDNALSSGKFTLLDITNSIFETQIFNSINKKGVSKVSQNDEVTLKGFMKFYNNNFIFSNKGDIPVEILKNQRGNSSISLGEHNNTIVRYDGMEFNDPKTIKNGQTFNFTVEAINDFQTDKVLVNEVEINEIDGVYSFIVNGNSEIKVFAVDSSSILDMATNYNIIFDLGGRRTSKILNSPDEVYKTFVKEGEKESIISSVIENEFIYGGGYGGRGESNWYEGDMLKFGTTSVNGSLTLVLKKEVIGVKITGYVADNRCKIQVGDNNSTDWTEDANDNKTTIFTCSTMNETVKDVVEGGQTSTIEVNFLSTKTLKIATTNSKPLYITNIEFITETV